MSDLMAWRWRLSTICCAPVRTTRVAGAFEGLVADQEARWQTLPKAWAPYLASEARLLGLVQHIILPEMPSRLRG